jgi:hypothetical protein
MVKEIKVDFSETGLSELDDCFNKLTEILEPIKETLESLESAKTAFMEATGFSNEKNPLLVNAIVGMVISFAADMGGVIEDVNF